MKKIIALVFVLIVKMSFAQTKEKKYIYGFVDIKTGEEITPLKYDKVFKFRNGAAIVMLDGKYGLINRDGKEIISINYDEITNCVNGLFIVTINKKYGVVNNLGKEICPLVYDYIDFLNWYDTSSKLCYVKLGKKYGLVNEKFEKISAIKYDRIYCNRGVVFVKVNDKYGFLNEKGIEITELKYDEIEFSVDIGKIRLTPVRIGSKWSFLDSSCKEVFPNKYDFYEGLGVYSKLYRMMKVQSNGKWGCVGEDLREVIPLKYDKIDFLELSGDISCAIVVEQDNKLGAFDLQGNEIVGVECEEIKRMYNVIFYKRNDKWGAKYGTGKDILTAKYEQIELLNDGDLFNVKINKKWGVNKALDQVVIPAKYDKSFSYSFLDSKITGTLKDKIIIFDAKGSVVSKRKKNTTKYIYDGICKGYNYSNKRLLEDEIEQINSDFTKVKKNDEWIFIDKEGREVIMSIKDGNKKNYNKEGIATLRMRIN